MYVTEQFVQSVHMTTQDRRITKTRKAIYHAFLHLLNQKDYETITVQEIIDLRAKSYYWMSSAKSSFTICLNVLNTSLHKTT